MVTLGNDKLIYSIGIEIMYAKNYFVQQSQASLVRHLIIILLALCTLSLAGCGSTKVYTANKSMVYRDNLYNMSGVQQISSSVEGKLSNGEVQDMKGMDKKAVEALLKENSPVMVSMIIKMDDKEMVYQQKEISKYSDYSKMSKSLGNAMSSIGKFMANSSSTQLKLK